MDMPKLIPKVNTFIYADPLQNAERDMRRASRTTFFFQVYSNMTNMPLSYCSQSVGFKL
jgi:hypothetical protein